MELKACPFCGNVYGDGGIQSNKLYWLCGRCGARLPKNNGWKILNEKEDRYYPLEWNTRATDPRLKEVVSRIKGCMPNETPNDFDKGYHDGLLIALKKICAELPELKEDK